MAFISLYFHSLDSKKRLFIPVRYRDELGDKFVIMKGPDNTLFLYPQEHYDIIAEQYAEKHRDIKTQTKFYSRASEATIDNQGRVTIEDRFVQHANLVKEVAIVGGGHRIEIWPIEKYKIAPPDAEDDVDFSEDISW